MDDGFPQYICMSCSVLLESAYQLKLLCAKTEEKLNEMRVGSKRTKSTDTETDFEINDDFIIEEITAKPDVIENNNLAESSHIEWVIIFQL